MNILVSLSGVYREEGWLERMGKLPDTVVLDFEDLEGTNSYCSDEAREEMIRAFAPLPLRSVHWIDTGDYHYLSELWMSKAEKPFALALFDNHSDRQEAAFGMLSCGSWVAVAEKTNPMMRPMAPGIPVFISIDTDVLSEDWARTDWNQGEMTWPELEKAVRKLASEHEIIGIDICGGLTRSKGATDEDLRMNFELREKLLRLCGDIIA